MRGLRVRRVIVCLVVGVVATWMGSSLVATALYRGWITEKLIQDKQSTDWPAGVPAAWPSNPSSSRSVHVLFDARNWIDEDGGHTNGYFQMSIDRYGWPSRATTRRSWFVVAPDEIDYLDERALQEFVDRHHPKWPIWDKGIESIQNRIRLPLRPVWPGFAVNTLFYASVAWVALTAPGSVRRWRRTRRGRCPACGYDMSRLNTCPECGGP